MFFFGMVGEMYFTTWVHLSPSKPVPPRGMTGTAVVLGDINQFFVRSVHLNSTETQTIDIYQYNNSCDDLLNSWNKQVKITHLVNLTNVYLLEGTGIDYHLTLPQTNTKEYVTAYLTSGFQTLNLAFNPHQLNEEDIICHRLAISNGQTQQCSHQVTRSGYYNVHFLLSSVELTARYNLSVTFANSTIPLSEENFFGKCTIDDEIGCDVSFSFGISVSCLVAGISKNNSSLTNSFQNVTMATTEFWITYVLVLTIPNIVFNVVAFTVIVLVIAYLCLPLYRDSQ